MTDLASEKVKSAAGDTHLLSMCMTRGEDMPRMCGEFWFLVPPVSSVLDKQKPDHQVNIFSIRSSLIINDNPDQVLLLVDKEQYNTQSEVIVYIPTSHVLLHDAEMLR